jgi:hypothetical protein
MIGEMKNVNGKRDLLAEGLSGADCNDLKTVKKWTTNTWSEGLNKQVIDVRQGCARDCFVLAAIGSIVAVDSSRLRKTASGYNFLPVGSSTAVAISIDKNLAVASDTTTDFVYARWSGIATRKYLWPMLWEKAYAKFLDQDNDHPDPIDPAQPDIRTILDGGSVQKAMKEIGRYKTFKEFEFQFEGGNPSFPSVAATSGTPPTGLTANHTYSVIKKLDNGNYQFRDQCGGIYKEVSAGDLTKAKFTTWGYVKDPI